MGHLSPASHRSRLGAGRRRTARQTLLRRTRATGRAALHARGSRPRPLRTVRRPRSCQVTGSVQVDTASPPVQAQPAELPLPDPNLPTGGPAPRRPRRPPTERGAAHGNASTRVPSPLARLRAQRPEAQMRASHTLPHGLCVHLKRTESYINALLAGLHLHVVGSPFYVHLHMHSTRPRSCKKLKKVEKNQSLNTALPPHRPGHTLPASPRGPAAPALKAARLPAARTGLIFPLSHVAAGPFHVPCGGHTARHAEECTAMERGSPWRALRHAFRYAALAHGQGAVQGRDPEADLLVHRIQ